MFELIRYTFESLLHLILFVGYEDLNSFSAWSQLSSSVPSGLACDNSYAFFAIISDVTNSLGIDTAMILFLGCPVIIVFVI